MSHHKGLLDLKETNKNTILSLFQMARSLQDNESFRPQMSGTVILLFLEPSTRTRTSFEVACHREGLAPVVISGKAATSLEKEETLEDTFLNLQAMRPKALIIRAGDDYSFEEIPRAFEVPLINAGWGVKGHPTQALLDAYTLHERWGSLEKRKILIIGDILHSRVAQSHFELSKILGYEVRVFAPSSFLPNDKAVQAFSRIEEGLEWCDAVMGLRTQKERHNSQVDLENFNSQWGLHPGNIKALNEAGLIMHPGPVNWGTELAMEIKRDNRNIILSQVENGVYIRQALLRKIQEGTW